MFPKRTRVDPVECNHVVAFGERIMTQSSFVNTLSGTDIVPMAIDATMEVGAYESLWLNSGATFKKIADQLAAEIGRAHV